MTKRRPQLHRLQYVHVAMIVPKQNKLASNHLSMGATCSNLTNLSIIKAPQDRWGRVDVLDTSSVMQTVCRGAHTPLLMPYFAISHTLSIPHALQSAKVCVLLGFGAQPGRYRPPASQGQHREGPSVQCWGHMWKDSNHHGAGVHVHCCMWQEQNLRQCDML